MNIKKVILLKLDFQMNERWTNLDRKSFKIRQT